MASSSRRSAGSAPRLFNTVRFGSRATLHRNLAGALFPERLPPEELKRLRDKVCDAAMASPSVLGKKAGALRPDDAQFTPAAARLAGRGEITSAFVDHADGTAFMYSEDGSQIVVNDEDHVTLSSQGDGKLADLAKRVHKVSQALEKRLAFARHPVYGYLSANPDNLGTGLRLHGAFCLFGLYLNKELDAALRAIERLGLSIRPLYLLSEREENPLEAPGCCYVVGSTQTMGREADIVEGMAHICDQLEIAETNARLRLVEQRLPLLVDFLTRSVAVGSTAVQLTESEGLDIVHAILMGVDFGLLELSEDDESMAFNVLTLMSHAALRQLVLPGTDAKPAVAIPNEPVGEGDGEDFAELRSSRAFVLRQLAIKLLPQCLEKLGYKAVVKEIKSRR
ncbi:MAG: hypothetical protein ACOX9C_08215 [Kiritimatiellia bacterium]